MQTLTLTLRPLSAFGTLPLGDTLFGQLCWLLRDGMGEAELVKLLDGYTTGKPFAVVSDTLPHGYVPRPNVPLYFFQQDKNADRKAVKKQAWLPLVALDQPFAKWLSVCEAKDFLHEEIQPHNSISRLTGTTGTGFAPYALDQHWYAENTTLDVHIVFDASRITADKLQQTFTHMGYMGFGRDASVGLGKFEVLEVQVQALPANANANAVLTLAPSAPQRLGFDTANSYYQLFTRFGRHGGQAVQSGKPFKTPVLLAKTGALFSSDHFTAETFFIGQGLGGNGQLSKQIPATVQQGYAPVIPIHFAPVEPA
jgi:CRISPR-associated protein Csm4